MAGLKFGIIYSALEDIIGPGEMAKQCEDWGYDSFWVPDFVLKPRLEAMAALAAAAQATSTIRLGTAVIVLPFRHPIQLAKSAVAVDRLSNGRLMLGLGIGADPREFEVMGQDLRQRAKMSDERIEIIKRLLSETNVTHRGRYHQFEDVTLGLAPVQKPHIPIWIGGVWKGKIAEGVIRRTARFADAFMVVDAPVQAYKEAQERIKRQAEEYGRDPSSIEWGIFLWVRLEDNPEEAQRKVNEELQSRRLDQGAAELGHSAALGTPQHCIQVIQEFADIGVTHFILDSASPGSEMFGQYEWIARDVLPSFRSGAG
ncbi:MAG: LLM class flavin-dependent oxidoreductase [Chloroflexi bacterium]|nr:LLM class flavin-dependent oxidoreductase [Chloroflexota bacterium]